MIGGLQGENGNLNNKYLKKKSKKVSRKYLKVLGWISQHATWAVKFRKLKVSISHEQADFAANTFWFRSLRNCLLAWCDLLPMAITSSFQLWFAQRLKCWTPDFPSFKMTYSMLKMDSRKCSKCAQEFLSSWISSCQISLFFYPPCIHDLLLAKDYKAPNLGFFM